MKAYGNAFSMIKNEHFYEIPFFQRNYVWNEDNWSEMLDSLCDSTVCPFLGSIILKENKDSENKFYWSVIDGQQRLTTLSILMRACFDELSLHRDTDYKSEADDEDPWGDEVRAPFQKTVYVKFGRQKDLKLINNHLDRKDYERVIQGEFKDNFENINSNEYGKIINCYAFFRKSLKEKNKETIKVIWKYLTRDIDDHNSDGKYLVFIELDEKEDEQAIFDTVNTAGVRLTCADTIKNTLFQRYIDALQKENYKPADARKKAVDFYKEQWLQTFSLNSEISKEWEKQRQVGRLYRDNIEILLHNVAVIKGFFDPEKNKLAELPHCYKKATVDMTRKDLEKLINEIKCYAELYHEYVIRYDSKTFYYYQEKEYMPRLMHTIDVLQISTFLPYILYILHENQNDETSPKDLFQELERYLILNAICGASTKNYNKECIQLIKGTASVKSLAKGDITYEKFEYGLRNINPGLATLILFWIELYKRSKEYVDFKGIPYAFTLEHIMPQKWEEFWSIQKLDVYDETNKVIEDEDCARSVREAIIRELGNMTLLNSALNTSLRNYDFKRKVEGEGTGRRRKKGMKNLSDCMITREIFDQPLLWDERKIRKRTADFSDLIKKIWNISFN